MDLIEVVNGKITAISTVDLSTKIKQLLPLVALSKREYDIRSILDWDKLNLEEILFQVMLIVMEIYLAGKNTLFSYMDQVNKLNITTGDTTSDPNDPNYPNYKTGLTSAKNLIDEKDSGSIPEWRTDNNRDFCRWDNANQTFKDWISGGHGYDACQNEMGGACYIHAPENGSWYMGNYETLGYSGITATQAAWTRNALNQNGTVKPEGGNYGTASVDGSTQYFGWAYEMTGANNTANKIPCANAGSSAANTWLGNDTISDVDDTAGDDERRNYNTNVNYFLSCCGVNKYDKYAYVEPIKFGLDRSTLTTKHLFPITGNIDNTLWTGNDAEFKQPNVVDGITKSIYHLNHLPEPNYKITN